MDHAHAPARWTSRTLRIDIEGWVDPHLPVTAADQLGHHVLEAVHQAVTEARAVTFTPAPCLTPPQLARRDINPVTQGAAAGWRHCAPPDAPSEVVTILEGALPAVSPAH
ncbi:MAG: hypothetical protein JO309_07755 [Pseudonocardiales bacterium]|nr:hypothetical protein [Pseudonocardiales bacterium]MBV9729282.1 hypothetical protein [Pseudonocardiales bacterium]